jgi:hypothetical protein
MQGIPSAAASLAFAAIRSTLQRLTPGNEPIGSAQSRPSQMNKGQMKSLGCSRFSASIARIHGDERPRRMRR